MLTNFNSETPNKYKLSSLIGSIYRANDTCTNESELNKTLDELTTNFQNNGYPVSLIKNKIKNIKKQNFTPVTKKIDWKKEIKENPSRNFTFNLDFTSSRCQKIENKFRKLIKSKTPKFNISFAWKNVKISRLFFPKTKPIIPKLLVTGSVYNYKCFCLKKYIGESKRPLITRIQEHQQSSRKTAICLHNLFIKECPDFQTELLNRYGHIPNRDITDFLSKRFEILHKNLSYFIVGIIKIAAFVKLFVKSFTNQN